MLYQVLTEHLETFLETVWNDDARGDLPSFVQKELRAFLDCGILAKGFVRVRCKDCGKDAFVAFSCKGRGFCPSCSGRRMADTAAHLVDRVLPRVPVRQWVLSLPFRIRFLLAYDPKLCAAVRSLFLRTILRFLRRRGEEQGFCDGRSGAVNVVQRFGSTLNLNVHFHALILDGVFTRTSPDEPPVFHALPPPSDDDIADLTEALRRRILRLLHRRGRLRDDEILEGSEQDTEPLLAACYAASIQGRVALGKDAGSAVQRTGKIPALSPVHPATRRRCAQIGGFSLHANVRIAARDRARLERICRYVARGPIAQDRLFQTKDGRVEYVLRTPFKDGTRSVLFEPLQFIEKLAALVPRPRAHLVTYHGVLAPAAEWRQDIVPTPPSKPKNRSLPKDDQPLDPPPYASAG